MVGPEVNRPMAISTPFASPEPAPPGVLTVYVTPDRGADSLGRVSAPRARP